MSRRIVVRADGKFEGFGRKDEDDGKDKDNNGVEVKRYWDDSDDEEKLKILGADGGEERNRGRKDSKRSRDRSRSRESRSRRSRSPHDRKRQNGDRSESRDKPTRSRSRSNSRHEAAPYRESEARDFVCRHRRDGPRDRDRRSAVDDDDNSSGSRRASSFFADRQRRLPEYCGPPLSANKRTRIDPEAAGRIIARNLSRSDASSKSVQSQSVSSTTPNLESKRTETTKRYEDYNSLLPGGAIAQLAMEAGSYEMYDDNYFYGYDDARYDDMTTTSSITISAPLSSAMAEFSPSTSKDDDPIVYGTPLVLTAPSEPLNPYPHKPLNVESFTLDPIVESRPFLSETVLSKLPRSFIPAKSDQGLEPISKKVAAKSASSLPTSLPPGKNPVQFLNEFEHGLTFDCVARVGRDNNPVFSMRIVWRDVEYVGEGATKKAAKNDAALKACNGWFATNKAVMSKSGEEKETTTTQSTTLPGFVRSAADGGPGPDAAPLSKSPLMLLNERRPFLAFVVDEKKDSASKSQIFTVSVAVEGKTFSGTAGNKKSAKNKCAEKVLKEICGMDFSQRDDRPAPMLAVVEEKDQKLADRIMFLVMEKFYSLTNMGLASTARRKVLAGIVMTIETAEGIVETNVSKVISLGTGTKCVGGGFLSESGRALNDCHAEIICRRGLLRFFYDQLRLHLDDDERARNRSVFARLPGSGRPRYRLKEGVDFHLFISSAPCGDGRIFSPHESVNEDGTSDEHPERVSRGQLRAKIECGEGTIPVANTSNADGVQTWDGIVQGERLLTMSCSDKLARWNVLGMQGSLLGHFVDPVYLKTLVLGSLFHGEHLSRALYGRLELESLVDALPPGFKLNRPRLCRLSSPEVKQDGKTPNFSVNWTLGDEGLEIVDSSTGKREQPDGTSRLCKRVMFERWAELNDKFDMLYPSLESKPREDSYYCDIKVGNKDFQTAKKAMFRAFADRELGNWVKKPVDQDMFCL